MPGIYVHFPFCKQKCIYCNFYSVTSLKLKDDYWNALCKEIELRKNYLEGKQIDTLYFGGGTPSLASPAELEKIINHLAKFHPLAHNLEFTLEANPEQLSIPYLKDLKSLGINRLSIGVQSFNDDILHLLNRQHSAADATTAVQNAASAGFDNLSIDLIYDIAFRSAQLWKRDLLTAVNLPISHLSCYSLTVEENTLLAHRIRKGQRFLPEDADSDRDSMILSEITQNAGFQQYEISNFAKNGKISRHNFAYWCNEPYLGLGTAAHSFLPPTRQWNVANILSYINGVSNEKPITEMETLSNEQQYDEYILLRLRTCLGVNLNEISSLFGKRFLSHLKNQLLHVNPAHYLLQNNTLRLTPAGRLFADAIAQTLFW